MIKIIRHLKRFFGLNKMVEYYEILDKIYLMFLKKIAVKCINYTLDCKIILSRSLNYLIWLLMKT